MREPVESMKERVLTGLSKAGRNKRQINRTLDKLEREIRQQTGEKDKEWTEEYYLYLLETYARAIEAAIPIAVRKEEYEWADALTARKASAEETISLMSVEK
jgi:hypothetical protein